MPAKRDLQEHRFGQLVVIAEAGRDKYGAALWQCKCDCGRTSVVRGAHLANGVTKSCGCGIRLAAMKPKTHGMSHSALYRRWQAMKERCGNPRTKEYSNYGGRGIAVCARWMQFIAFNQDMGSSFRPELELDRIDNCGNYEPSNCRWTGRKEQQRNRRNNRVLMIGGVAKTLVEWAEMTGIKANTILTRVRRGWPASRWLELVNAAPLLLEAGR